MNQKGVKAFNGDCQISYKTIKNDTKHRHEPKNITMYFHGNYFSLLYYYFSQLLLVWCFFFSVVQKKYKITRSTSKMSKNKIWHHWT
jgi:hypothetical protein